MFILISVATQSAVSLTNNSLLGRVLRRIILYSIVTSLRSFGPDSCVHSVVLSDDRDLKYYILHNKPLFDVTVRAWEVIMIVIIIIILIIGVNFTAWYLAYPGEHAAHNKIMTNIRISPRNNILT